jgi:hypothetical protein
MAGTTWRRAALACAVALMAQTAQAEPAPQVETIVMLRHGEKPADGLGQLNCQGLNRALALPAVIAAKFGKPAAIFAPNPAARKPDGAGTYYYIRPLATIEPTAITLGMPVNAGFAYSNIAGLRQALVAPKYHGALVLVAWEHKKIVDLARALLAAYHGDAKTVPAWDSKDFDSTYTVRLTWSANGAIAAFSRGNEGLNNRPEACPSGK